MASWHLASGKRRGTANGGLVEVRTLLCIRTLVSRSHANGFPLSKSACRLTAVWVHMLSAQSDVTNPAQEVHTPAISTCAATT